MARTNNEVSGWVGWISFAGIMLAIAGILHVIAGFAALFKDTVYVVTEKNLWMLDYTQWGWIHIIWGALAIWAASSLMSGRMYGRIVATLVASVSLIVNMLFIPVYPVWSLLIIAVDVFVIFAVIVHGSELRDR